MLQKIIHQLNERDYSLLSMQMEKTRADKYLLLLNNYRNEKIADKELLLRMNLNTPAFYTLKSRLYEKVQYFLFKNTEETRTELIQNIAKIDHLVYNTPRETSIPILKRLEAELIKNDMPNELIIVYKALKKVHLNTAKYYEYSLLYNKHVAYNLAQDKAEDTLASFCKVLGGFFLSRDELDYNKLKLLKKEMDNVCRLYDSHRLTTYKNILSIQYALFLSGVEQDYDSVPVEQLLSDSTEIIEKFKDDKVYKFLALVLDYLHFEYYHQLKLQKKALVHYNKIVNKTETLLLFNHTCFTSHFLISKIDYKSADSFKEEQHTENELAEDEPGTDDMANYILFYYNQAAELYTDERYSEAIQKLNTLIRKISFKNISFIEVELKLFLSVLYILNKDEVHSCVIIKNLTRKIKDDKNTEKYEVAAYFIKFLKAITKNPSNKRDGKGAFAYQMFKIVNKGRYKIFEFLLLKDDLFSRLVTKQR